MTSTFALEYIRMRMIELGIGEYFLKWRHFRLAPEEVREINAGDHFYFVINDIPNISIDPPHVRVESDFGVWDYGETATNEMIYEHRGKITLTSQEVVDPSGEGEITGIQMIQVIPKNKEEDGNI